MISEFDAVVQTLTLYFDGLYHSDTQRLSKVFHPQAIYACATETPLLYYTMDTYLPLVDARPAPASRNEMRRDRILSIEFAGPVTAIAKVNCAIGPKFFIDLLTLIKVDSRWQIIAKVFHYDLQGASECPT